MIAGMDDTHIVQDQSEVEAFLADPATHGGAAVQRVDTHGAMVFVAGDRACKIKRAVAYPYMNFSTLDRRRAACQAEIRLNRRTAPEIYLDARPIRRRPDGGLAFGGDAGEVVEWVVVMRRFDQDALFDRMAARGALTPALIDRLAEEIAAFHAAAERRGPEHAPDMAWVIEESLAEFREDPALFPAGQVDRLAALSRAALGRLAPLLQERAAGGFVRHCHGDLHLRNVALVDDRPAIFDAIEFNDSLAVIDVLYDLAFMLMDLDHRGLRGLGNRLFNRYLDIVNDDEGLAALPLFLSARAAIRAKVARSIAASTADAAAAERQRAEAPDYLARAIDYLEPPPPRLLAIGVSTGGPFALQRVIPALPDNLPVPVVVVQHMPPHFTRSLATRLDSTSALHVAEAEDGMSVKPGHVIIAAGGHHLVFRSGARHTIVKTPSEPSDTLHCPSVDVMFSSAAKIKLQENLVSPVTIDKMVNMPVLIGVLGKRKPP